MCRGKRGREAVKLKYKQYSCCYDNRKHILGEGCMSRYSCISLGQDEERRKYQAQGGRKQRMSPQPAKVRTHLSAKLGSRRCQRQHKGFWEERLLKAHRPELLLLVDAVFFPMLRREREKPWRRQASKARVE